MPTEEESENPFIPVMMGMRRTLYYATLFVMMDSKELAPSAGKTAQMVFLILELIV